MKFMLFVLPTVPATLEERKRLRPIGRNNERYQQMLDELRKLAIFADEAGFDVFATTEHHLHSEGYETSVAPLLLYADLAARTKRIKFSPLGLVLPSWDPVRVAEELAVLDHLTKGRLYAGFARGYQDRWVNVLGQQYHVTGAPMDGSAIDNHNRRVYEENLKVIKKAWTEEAWDYNGEYYKVPFPYEEGIRRWPVAEWTRTYGAPGEVDEEGVVRNLRRAEAVSGPSPADIPTVLGEREHDPLYRTIGCRPVDPCLLSARFLAPVPTVPGGGGGERSRPPARRERRRFPLRPLRPHRRGGGGAVPRHQLRRLLPLFQRVRFCRGVPLARGR
ncbi:MAG: LLM class flavin-dependent oxidoreductase [Alphaproteobacteria bacterium]|nr:LLM class flavin-dependent oxidoreductase [Alphaproteobacteria bacterium]